LDIAPIITIYFFYGLAFFSMGLLVMVEGGRSYDQTSAPCDRWRLVLFTCNEWLKCSM
jgi:hypothetical protein